MGRAPCCDKANVKRGPWSPDEDDILRNYLEKHGTGGNWIALPHKAGLRRCGKSCRLRWLNYLRPDIKHGGFTPEEDNIICSLYSSIGSRWSIIASHLPGRTDNDVKNYWNTKLKKKLPAGKIGVAVFNKSSNHESSTSNLSSGQFSASVPIEAGVEARVDQGNSNNYYDLKANGSTSLSYTTDMKHQQIYGYCQIEEFPLPGLMEVPDRYSNNYSIMSSSQEASSRLSNSPSFPMENINFATHWSVKDEGADEDQGNILTDLDFEGPPYVSSGSSFQEESNHEVIPCFGIFPSTTSLANSYYW